MSGAGIARFAGLWSVLAFIFNLTWEIAHVRFYTLWSDADAMEIARAVLHCSLGDVVIALSMFALAVILLGRVEWPTVRPWAGGIIVTVGATAFTAWSEWFNVYRSGAWSYTSSMPTIYGIGLSPLLQWLIIPSVIVVACRVLLPVLLGKSGATKCPAGEIRRKSR